MVTLFFCTDKSGRQYTCRWQDNILVACPSHIANKDAVYKYLQAVTGAWAIPNLPMFAKSDPTWPTLCSQVPAVRTLGVTETNVIHSRNRKLSDGTITLKLSAPEASALVSLLHSTDRPTNRRRSAVNTTITDWRVLCVPRPTFVLITRECDLFAPCWRRLSFFSRFEPVTLTSVGEKEQGRNIWHIFLEVVGHVGHPFLPSVTITLPVVCI